MPRPEVHSFRDDATPAPGELVAGRYRVEALIGSGGMGRVVAARDENGAAVAIKLLVAPAWRSVLVERFFREARTVSRIDSPHVVKVLSVSAPNERTPFMVMERLNGRDFGARLEQEGPLTLSDVADCMMQACAALASSHALGVIHRDVKPSNLFDHRDANGVRTVKVLDFGISKARASDNDGAESDWTLTTTRDTMLGSPPYMSPEHLRDARTVDHRTDIWSLGVVAYQLLTGRLPFEGKTVGALFCSVLERKMTALGTMLPDLPRPVEAIVDRCLSSSPDARFQNAAELARAFAPFASPRFAALAAKMTTSIAVQRASGVHASGRLSSAVAAARLDGDNRTMTVAPAMAQVEVASIAAAARAPELAPVAAANVGPSPFDDDESRALTTVLTRRADESVPAFVAFVPVAVANTNAHLALNVARRTRGFAAAACTLLVALLASPFAFSSAATRIEPATASAAVAVAVAPVETRSVDLDDDVTFTVVTPTKAVPVVARADSPRPRPASVRSAAKKTGRALDPRR